MKSQATTQPGPRSVAASTHNGWKDLGTLVKHERVRLGFTTRDLANKSGIGLRTLERIEAGHAVLDTNLAKLDIVFGWPALRARRIGLGQEPAMLIGPDGTPIFNDNDERRVWAGLEAIEAIDDHDRRIMLVAYRQRQKEESATQRII